MTRREQWISFYTAALAGTADFRVVPGESADGHRTADWLTEQAERNADSAMARLDARDFPESKVEALLSAARRAWRSAEHGGQRGAFVSDPLLAALGKAIAAFNDGSASPETEQS